MNTRLTLILCIIMVATAALLSIYAYPQMPEQAATHWNARGEADGYSSRLSAVLIMPLVMIAITALLLAIPLIDPLRSNIRLFLRSYNFLIIFTSLFFLYLHLITILWNLGVLVNMNITLSPAFGLLLFGMGFLVEKARRNYMIGIRTPWTLASETVWDKTHRLGGKLFKAAGLLVLLGVLFPDYTFLFLLVPVLAAVIWATLYSYFLYRSEEKAG